MNERISDRTTAGSSVLSAIAGSPGKIIDISLELDASKFRMRTYEGFKKDMQFEIEVIKDYDDGGLGQLVRGAHMRLHAGTHVDAPSHMVKGGKDIHDLPIEMFIGPAVVADVRHKGPKEGIFAADLEKAVGIVFNAAIAYCCGPISTKSMTVHRSGLQRRHTSAMRRLLGVLNMVSRSSDLIFITAKSRREPIRQAAHPGSFTATKS